MRARLTDDEIRAAAKALRDRLPSLQRAAELPAPFSQKPFRCPRCGVLNDMASAIDHAERPHPGALTICLKCQHVQIYDDALSPRELTDEEALESEAMVDDALKLLRKLNRLNALRAKR